MSRHLRDFTVDICNIVGRLFSFKIVFSLCYVVYNVHVVGPHAKGFAMRHVEPLHVYSVHVHVLTEGTSFICVSNQLFSVKHSAILSLKNQLLIDTLFFQTAKRGDTDDPWWCYQACSGLFKLSYFIIIIVMICTCKCTCNLEKISLHQLQRVCWFEPSPPPPLEISIFLHICNFL